MRKEVYLEYVQKGWTLFKLVPVEDGVGNAVKGAYMTPKGWNTKSKNSKYSEDAVYGGIPPSNILVLDVDVKKGKVGDASFKNFLVDSKIGDLDRNVTTPSLGYHVYIEIPENVLYRKKQKAYPDIDFIVHGREFVVLGDQSVEGYGDYVLNPIENDNNTKVHDLGHILEERLTYDKVNYSDIDLDEHYMTRMVKEDIEALLAQIDPDVPYDEGWRDVVMALNQWDLGGEVGFELLKKWNETSVMYDTDEDELLEKYSQNVSSTTDFWKKLIGLANSTSVNTFESAIKNAKNTDDLMEIASNISHSSISNDQREELANDWREKFGNVPNPSKHTKPHKKRLVEDIFAFREKVDLTNIPNIFMIGGNNYVLEGKTLISEIGPNAVKKILRNMGYSDGEIEAGVSATKQVLNLSRTADYVIEDDLVYELVQIEKRKLYEMTIKHNPLYGWEGSCFDKHIVDDFFTDIWQGKVDDIVKIIALSIKTGETKLNRLMLVAPSNTGKSEMFNHLNFQKIVMKRLVNAMNGDKGVGSKVIEGLRYSSLMLIDEANTALSSEIKDMDKEIHIDQFGTGGTQIIPLMFTTLTSTHSTATRNASDELYNRFLQVELHNPEHTLNESELFKEDRDRYTEVVKTHMIELFLNTLKGSEGKRELLALQEKYRLPLNSDLDEFLYEVSEKVIGYVKSKASYDGDILVRSGEYFIKRKKDLVEVIEDMVKELSSIDHGKYIEKMSKHFIGDEKKSVRMNDVVRKVYPLNLVTYTQSKEQEVRDMFDDLDIDDL